MKFAQSVVGQERVAYHARSQLALDLISIMRYSHEVFAKWYAVYPSKHIDRMFIRDGAKVVEDAISQKIIDTIKKHTGIQLRSFEIDTDDYTVLSNAWCGTMLRGLTKEQYDSQQSIIEFGNTDDSAAYTTYLDARSTIYKLIDIRSGTVSPELNKYVVWRMGMTLAPFMYPSTGLDFLSHLFSGIRTDGVLADTAEEMASTVLHELGHALFVVFDGLKLIKASDNLLDTYHTVSVISEKNPGSLPSVVSDMVGQSSAPSAAAAKVAAAAVARLPAIDSAKTLKTALTCATAIATSMARDGFEAVTSMFMDKDEYDLIRVNIGAMSKKAGELTTTGRQKQRVEIIADSFATRHGLGPELALSLSKINSIFNSDSAAIKTIEESNRKVNILNAAFRPLCALNAMINAAKSPVRRLSSQYPDELNRCKFIFMEHMNFFKTLPRTPANEEVITQWVIAGRKLDHLYTNMNKDPNIIAVRDRLVEMGFENTRGTFGGGLLSGNTHNDYRKMQDAVDDLIKSAAYYHAENFMTE